MVKRLMTQGWDVLTQEPELAVMSVLVAFQMAALVRGMLTGEPIQTSTGHSSTFIVSVRCMDNGN